MHVNYDILSDIVSHCNGFIRTATTQTVLEDHGRACEALSDSIKFTHNTIRRLFSYANTAIVT
jgi:hypothetical protein